MNMNSFTSKLLRCTVSYSLQIQSDPFTCCKTPTIFIVGSEGTLTSVEYLEVSPGSGYTTPGQLGQCNELLVHSLSNSSPCVVLPHDVCSWHVLCLVPKLRSNNHLI